MSFGVPYCSDYRAPPLIAETTRRAGMGARTVLVPATSRVGHGVRPTRSVGPDLYGLLVVSYSYEYSTPPTRTVRIAGLYDYASTSTVRVPETDQNRVCIAKTCECIEETLKA